MGAFSVVLRCNGECIFAAIWLWSKSHCGSCPPHLCTSASAVSAVGTGASPTQVHLKNFLFGTFGCCRSRLCTHPWQAELLFVCSSKSFGGIFCCLNSKSFQCNRRRSSSSSRPRPKSGAIHSSRVPGATTSRQPTTAWHHLLQSLGHQCKGPGRDLEACRCHMAGDIYMIVHSRSVGARGSERELCITSPFGDRRLVFPQDTTAMFACYRCVSTSCISLPR